MTIEVWATASASVTMSDVVSLTMLDNKRCAIVQTTDTGELYTSIRDVHHIVAPYNP